MATTSRSSPAEPVDDSAKDPDIGPDVVLAARGLSAGYGHVPVLHDVDLTVRRGEVVTILGANGAGKTTTLLTLAGILPSAEGSVFLHGRREQRSIEHRVRDGLAFVPEERSVITELTTRDNLRLGRGSIEDALVIAPELERLLDRPAGLLSGGEQQMLTLARALASKPTVLMADELSLGLAPKIVDRLLRIIVEAASTGVGVLLVEQHARKSLRHCHRAYVLRRGRVALRGEAAELLVRLPEIESTYLSVNAA